MIDILAGVGISAFAATDIDDLFVLMLFFSSSIYHKWQVVVGQFVGIGALVTLSTLGSVVAFVIPLHIIGLLGLVPISIGIIKLSQLIKNSSKTDEIIMPVSRWNNHLRILTVAGVTFSNGGDNIGIYAPLFAKYSLPFEVAYLYAVFMIMTALWCIVAYYLVNHPRIASRMRSAGHILLPFVLIGIGVYILSESFVFGSLF